MAKQNEKYNVVISARATQALVSQAAFLAQVSESAAERLITSFESAAISLEAMPHRCPWLTGDFIPHNVYRKLLFENRYLLIFQIIDEVVYVDTVVDCRQDYTWLIH